MMCLQRRDDCIFNTAGRCDILTDTIFKRPCPFYKKGKKQTAAHDIYIDGYSGVFRAVEGFEGLYYVDENGNVYSMRKKRFMTWKHYNNGQPFVTLTKESGQITSRVIDRLVADAFLGGDGMVIHKDGDIDNCNVWNLYRKGEDNGN